MQSFRPVAAAFLAGACYLAGVVQGQTTTYGTPSRLPLPLLGDAYGHVQLQGYSSPQQGWPQSGAGAAPSSLLRGTTNLIGAPPVVAPRVDDQGVPGPSLDGPAASPGCVGPHGYIHTHSAEAPFGPNCETCGHRRCRCGTTWFGGVHGLFMTRDDENHYFFSYDDNNEAVQLTNSRDAGMGWGGGFDIRFGRHFNCGRNGWEAVYWGLFPDDETTLTTAADAVGNLNGILNWDDLSYNGMTADNWVNNAAGHAVFRDFEFHNVELNLLQFCGYPGHDACDSSPLRCEWLAGVRFFKFHENLLFGADTVDTAFTYAPEEIYYNIHLDNHLVGVQIGGEGQYDLGRRCTFDFGVKLGLYGNHITHQSRIGGAAGIATINNGPNNGVPFWVDNSKNDVAFLGEAKLGVEYCLTDRWTATAGYRAVAVTGVALPTNQIYPDLRGIQDVEMIDSNGSLILHGAYAGIQYRY